MCFAIIAAAMIFRLFMEPLAVWTTVMQMLSIDEENQERQDVQEKEDTDKVYPMVTIESALPA